RASHRLPQAKDLKGDMGKDEFNKYVLECLPLLSPEDFADIWVGIPRELRAVAWRPPPGIIVDIDSLKGVDRIQMCSKLNALRRERCIQLASPRQQSHFEDENWTITPMSRLCCSRFWECFRLLPLTTTNESKWTATVKYLSKCPEKADSSDTSRHIDASTRASDSLGEAVAPDRVPGPKLATPKKGLAGLSALADATPLKAGLDAPPADRNSEEFATWVSARIQADVDGLSLDSLEVKHANRFPCKLKPSAALKTLPPLDVMSPIYQHTFQFYLRKFKALLTDVSLGSAPAKSLKRLCDALNLEVRGKDSQVSEVLARLRATDMVQCPPCWGECEDQEHIASACGAALCLLALLRFWFLGLTKGKMEAEEIILRHRFPGCGLCALAAWRLSRSAWVYVVQRVTNNESGWRRARALRMLRRIAGIRRDLPSPIAVISCDIPWVGSQQARNLAVHAVRSLVASWRRAGHWLPTLRHARIRFRWATTPSLGSVLCSRDFFADFAMVRPPCVCREFLLADPTWPTVTVDGQVHIAASQARIPWPRHLRKFRELPANLRLPPRRQQIAVAVKQMLRRLRDRCKLADEPCWVESVVADLTAALQGLAAQHSTRFPVSWLEISLAREFLRPFFTQVFDHNLSRIGVFCPALVHVQACAALDLGDHGTGLDFAWEADTRRAEVMATMAKIEGLPPHLQPTRLSLVPARSWSIGTPVFLPKWKGPGVKWRLIVNKHHAPAWSDFPSANAFLGMVSDFNALVKSMFMEPRGWIAAMDMVDCFHHLPCSEAPSIWDALSAFWSARHVAYISVPLRRGGGAGLLGLVCDAGWIREVLMHFTLTNFVALPGLLGRELRGAPMGDALSGAVLRLFKWSREAAQLPVEEADTVCFRRSCSQLVHLCGCNMLVLDVSFRDDLRMFCVWDGQAIIDRERVAQWAISRLRTRYHYGTMSLE
ncbi:unnamed protein product, partial [Durusdinium trenchii]